MTKTQLKSYVQNKNEICQLRDTIQQLYTNLASPGAVQYSAMSAYHGAYLDKLGIGTVKLLDLCEMYEDKLAKLMMQQKAIEDAISCLDSEERRIMRYRYIDGEKWETVCLKMGFNGIPMPWNTLHNKHRKALKKICNE